MANLRLLRNPVSDWQIKGAFSTLHHKHVYMHKTKFDTEQRLKVKYLNIFSYSNPKSHEAKCTMGMLRVSKIIHIMVVLCVHYRSHKETQTHSNQGTFRKLFKMMRIGKSDTTINDSFGSTVLFFFLSYLMGVF